MDPNSIRNRTFKLRRNVDVDSNRTGYCLYTMGCKGPVTYQNCPQIRWNEGTNWPIGCGHPCIGCAEPDFWDKMTPFYQHLPNVPGFGRAANLDRVGLWATAGVAAAFATHGVISMIHRSAGPKGDETPPPPVDPAPKVEKGDRP